MARKRKTEVKNEPPSSTQQTTTAVRKSSRQIARKQQLEERKMNTSSSNSPNESATNSGEDQNPTNVNKKTSKKYTKHKTIDQQIIVYDKKDLGESDSQDNVDVKLTLEDVRQMVVGSPLAVDKTAPNEIEIWTEEVIEETIICEEMVVEDQIKSTSSSPSPNCYKLDDRLADMQISDRSKEIEKLVNDLSSLDNIDSPTRCAAATTPKVSPPPQDEESSSSILDKMEQIHQQGEPDKGLFILNALGNIEEIKLSSSSENSNDTSASSNSNVKTNQDPTGAGVRRSSRIRSIGLMKQRSRGRGLVTKSSTMNQDLTKNQSPSQDVKNSPDIRLDIPLDKDQRGKGSLTPSVDSQSSSAPTSTSTGYDSDSSKPVKVKSRWRRSSELEMSGSNSWTTVVNNTSLSSILENKIALDCQGTGIDNKNGENGNLLTANEIKDEGIEERLSQFDYLTENLYLTDRFTNKETKGMVCDCFLTEEEIERGELGCGEDCLNRLLMIECGPRCVVGNRCTNKRFQNNEYAKCEVFKTDKKGLGLRATADIQVGEFIMEYVGEVVDPKDFRKRAKEYSNGKNIHYYFMALKSDQIIDATMKGNVSRFINHSCDPNSETQKWTVNGELRIGFFNKKFVNCGEEITFDYHFQRYGKEAQKCYCEATNCRGWIGETPEEEKDKTEKKEKRDKESVRKKKEEKKPTDYVEDEDLEEEIEKLCSAGLKNRSQTLNLSRLMVRCRELNHRTRLLSLIQSGEQPCRRLFLDYHGLRLIWSYVMDIAKIKFEKAQIFRLEIVKTLIKLPIQNKTMVVDSKLYDMIEKWSKGIFFSSDTTANEDSQEDDEIKEEKIEVKEELGVEIDNNSDQSNLIRELASNLLAEWSNLKEIFRIPKKERIEQMKEHEREADRGYSREELEKEEIRSTSSYDRHRTDRYSSEKRSERKRGGRESPMDIDYNRSKDKRIQDERSSLVPIPRMTKHERRQLFALKVAKEEEERQRRQQQESWQEHETSCLALGVDPHSTAMVDPQTGYPVFFNHALAQWQHYSVQDGEISGSSYLGHQSSLIYPMNQVYPMLPHRSQPYQDTQKIESQTVSSTPEISPIDLPPKWKSAKDARGRTYYYHVRDRMSQWLPPPPDHIGVQPDSSSSEESSDEESSSSNDHEDEEEIDDTDKEIIKDDEENESEQIPPEEEIENDKETNEEIVVKSIDDIDIDVENIIKDPRFNPLKKLDQILFPEVKKKRDGLVQERIISPRREEDRPEHKKYKDVKDKLKRQKEKAKMKEQVDKLKKHRRKGSSRSHSRSHSSKTNISDEVLSLERKIKDTFRINMANVMVHFLNPYRKNDCKQGRITNTEDFKHLARKLTHFVLAKELKHCKSVDELQCNDNVKHKAKDFVRKYMNKFGAVYQKTDEE